MGVEVRRDRSGIDSLSSEDGIFLGGVLVRSMEGSHKFVNTRRVLAYAGLEVPVAAVKIKIDEGEFNGLDWVEHIAALKAVQISKNPEAMAEGCLNCELNGREVVSVATDVMLDRYFPEGSQPEHKLKVGSSDELLEQLDKRFMDNGERLGFRVRMGTAAFFLRQGVGAFNYSRRYFETKRPTVDELRVYVYGLEEARDRGVDVHNVLVGIDIPNLSEVERNWMFSGVPVAVANSVNMGVVWEHPIMNRLIESIGKKDPVLRKVDPVRFAIRRLGLRQHLQAVPATLPQLIEELGSFSATRGKGNATDQMISAGEVIGLDLCDTRWLMVH